MNRADKHIIQSIAILDQAPQPCLTTVTLLDSGCTVQMDKDLNTFAMRVREWYSWHFPEMVKVTTPAPSILCVL